jgi:light-regulated signal transduction histidine kinase (bacteriophytochrome)
MLMHKTTYTLLLCLIGFISFTQQPNKDSLKYGLANSPNDTLRLHYAGMLTETYQEINHNQEHGGEVKEKIFQPFFTTKPSGQGTGLGLSLSYDIIAKEHAGQIKVESTEGEGAEFAVLLPV